MQSYEEIEKSVIKELDKQKRNWDSIDDDEWYDIMDKAVKKAKREFQGKINAIKRQSANFYPQSINADMVKLSTYLFDKYFEGADETEGLILTIHDEQIAEVRDENVEKACEALKKAMVKAGQKFLGDGIYIDVEPKVMTKWEK